MQSQQFPYSYNPRNPGGRGLPYIPITLLSKHATLQGHALLDSGATINVLPYQLGLDLGGVWNSTPSVKLSGALGKLPAYILKVATQVGDFAPQVLTYAWTRKEEVPIIFGLIDFFWEYNVCFFAAENSIEIALRQGQ
jgi:hypothetical protein